jgi:hypothetical protein
MVVLIRHLIGTLSDTAGAWEEFRGAEMGYFLLEGDLDGVDSSHSSLLASYTAVKKVFRELGGLLKKLERLKKELCDDNPQGVSVPKIVASGNSGKERFKANDAFQVACSLESRE